MSLPSGATAGVLLPFFGALGITSLFSFCYLRRYRNPYEKDACSFATAVISLIIVLITSALLPVDIFLVSSMKNQDGSFQAWAVENSTRQNVENALLYTYYSLYGVIFGLIFGVIPFVYFYFEEKNDDGFGNENRLCSAFKFTLGFIFVAVVLLLIGAFVPLKEIPNAQNSTDWDNIKFLISDLGKNRGEDSISMVLSILSVFGMVNLVFYTGFGIFSWPMGMIRGTKSARNQIEEIQDQHLVNQTRINALRDKERLGGRLTTREKRLLATLEDAERDISREEQAVDEHQQSLSYKLRVLLRPMEVTCGALLGLLGMLIWFSLLLTNIDKAMHGKGMKMGYALANRTLPNPMDIILVNLQRVFPLDYILMFVVTWFLVLATLSGIRNLGVRILFVRMAKLRVKRTKPQGLLLSCITLMLTVLAVNIFVYCVSPQYATFGSQRFVPASNGSLDNTVAVELFDEDGKSYGLEVGNNTTEKSIPCTLDAPDKQCTKTRSSALLLRFFYKAWFFGAFYYWACWAFIGISALALFYVILRPTRSVTEGLNDEDDLEESDGEEDLLTTRRASRNTSGNRN